MAKRRNKVFFKVDSEAVQGEGSWVMLRRMTYEQMKDLIGSDVSEKEAGFEMVKRSVVDWDWVDDDDKPLPKPPADPSVIERLPQEELNFLLQALGYSDKKNDLKN